MRNIIIKTFCHVCCIDVSMPTIYIVVYKTAIVFYGNSFANMTHYSLVPLLVVFGFITLNHPTSAVLIRIPVTPTTLSSRTVVPTCGNPVVPTLPCGNPVVPTLPCTTSLGIPAAYGTPVVPNVVPSVAGVVPGAANVVPGCGYGTPVACLPPPVLGCPKYLRQTREPSNSFKGQCNIYYSKIPHGDFEVAI